MRTVIGVTLVFTAMFGFYRLGVKHGTAAAAPCACITELGQTERCIQMVERATRTNLVCLDILGRLRDAGSY